MTDTDPHIDQSPTQWDSPAMQARLRARYRAERRFRWFGLSALVMAGMFLVILVTTLAGNGLSGMFQTYIRLDVHFDPAQFSTVIKAQQAGSTLSDSDQQNLIRRANYSRLISAALYSQFPDVTSRADRRRLRALVSASATSKLRDMVLADPTVIGESRRLWLLASDDIDQLEKGAIDPQSPEEDRRVKDQELQWVASLHSGEFIDVKFHTDFFTKGDSRDPENVGIYGAIVGTVLTLFVTFVIAFPLGVGAAIYLEEFAKQNRVTNFIEININNLAAVPSIVFGLLGLALFLGVMELPRSAPLVGGLTLSMMTLPTIIITARAAIRRVPMSVREAALGLGASKSQMVFHHIIPLAMPGILTGTILGMAQALGETAPLLMIGMVAFVVDIPTSVMDAATVLPVQIFIWANSPERLFIEKTAAAILVLLVFLISMNGLAIWLREKFEKQW